MLRARGGGLGAVRVGSVDDYQGQEEDIVIISTVLALGSEGAAPALAHGLMSSPQRFNVAISRAKMLLLVVGEPNALFEDDSWRQLLQYAVDNNAYRGCPHPLMMEGAPDEDDGLAEATRQVQRRIRTDSDPRSLRSHLYQIPPLSDPTSVRSHLSLSSSLTP